MADSVDILKKLAQQVRNATQEGENTAERVGRVLVGIIENLSQYDIEKLSEYFLRKDQSDATNFLLKFGNFIDSLTAGKGAGIYPDGRGQFEKLEVRSAMIVKS